MIDPSFSGVFLTSIPYIGVTCQDLLEPSLVIFRTVLTTGIPSLSNVYPHSTHVPPLELVYFTKEVEYSTSMPIALHWSHLTLTLGIKSLSLSSIIFTSPSSMVYQVSGMFVPTAKGKLCFLAHAIILGSGFINSR